MIGIIDVGGGMRGIYTAGVYDYLLDHKVRVDYCLGVSAGAANLVSYLSGQRGRNHRYYTNYANRPEYMSLGNYLKKGSYFDVDYIYSTLSDSHGEDPIDYAAFAADPTPYVVVATDAETGLPRYFTRADVHPDDFDVVKASCSLPIACRPYVIDGVPYFDGGMSDPVPYRRAMDDGCDRVVVLLTRPKDFRRPPLSHPQAARLALRHYPRALEALPPAAPGLQPGAGRAGRTGKTGPGPGAGPGRHRRHQHAPAQRHGHGAAVRLWLSGRSQAGALSFSQLKKRGAGPFGSPRPFSIRARRAPAIYGGTPMIQISNIHLPLGGGEDQLRKKAERILGLRPGQIEQIDLVRQSVDARRKSDVHYVCTVRVSVAGEEKVLARCRDKNVTAWRAEPYVFPPVRRTSPLPPVVVGMGPAGLFAALFLARAGLPPVVLERGRPVEERTEDVERFWATGQLSRASNVQFGEGGAGTFSDGKLTTGTHDGRIPAVLSALVEFGAPADIVWSHKPHIGTDVLRMVVKNLRQELRRLGCDVRFGHRLTGLEVREGRLAAVTAENEQGGRVDVPCDALILAPGHSARDTFRMLHEAGVPMEQKAFAVGVRIEHRQAAISQVQYGPAWERLPAADYKLSCHLPNGRSAFTFCVCPGGQVWPPPATTARWSPTA